MRRAALQPGTFGAALGVCAALQMLAAWAAGPTGVRLDGTLGGAAGTLSGPTYNITQSLGSLSGGNLFFSFQYFSIGTGQTALFTTTSPGINNVVSRVTGAYASSIDGTIKLLASAGAPDFFLINPNGVTFTANAAIDVPAAFRVTTANYLKFSDGNFYADPAKISTLSAAAPEAFGFLGTTRAPVSFSGSRLNSGSSGAGDVQVVAGDVTVDGAGRFSGIETTTGNIQVVATGAQTIEVPLTGNFVSNDGSVTLQNGGELAAYGTTTGPAGSIDVSAATLQVTGGALGEAGLFSQAGSAGAAPLTVNVAGNAGFSGGGNIRSLGANGANIELNAGELTISGPSPIAATGMVSTGGAIDVSVGSLLIDGTSSSAMSPFVGVGSNLSGTWRGTGGSVDVRVAQSATLTSGGSIFADTYGTANAGALTVTAGTLSVDGQASPAFTGIASSASSGSSGNTGRVSISTLGPTSIAGGGEIESNTNGSGNAGGVSIQSSALNLDGGAISSSAFKGAQGSAGDIAVSTTGAIVVSQGGAIVSLNESSGQSGNVTITAGSLDVDRGTSSNFTGISTSAVTGSSAASGNVEVTTSGATTLVNGGAILSATDGSGNAGDVSISAGSLSIDGGSATAFTGIGTSALTASSGGSGRVSVTTSGATALLSGGEIQSSTAGLRDAGNVTIDAGSLTIDGQGSHPQTGISSAVESRSSANAGSVSVTTTGATTISNGGGIQSNTYGLGNAGSVEVNAGSLALNGGVTDALTVISTSAVAGSKGNAGQISLVTQGPTTVANDALISSATFSSGNGGDVAVNAGSVTVTNAIVSSSAALGSTGNAGKVSVSTTGATTVTNGGEILSATVGPGNGGDVAVNVGSLTVEQSQASSTSLISSSAARGSSGNAGQVSVSSPGGFVIVTSGGQILSSTFSSGHAGDVTVSAAAVTVEDSQPQTTSLISSSAERGSSGNAGQVSVFSPGGAVTVTTGGQILSSTFSSGHAGDVTVNAASVTVEDSPSFIPSLISSSAERGSSGNAGQVSVLTTGSTMVSGGGQILSATFGPGNAGAVSINAGSLTIDGTGTTNFASEVFSDAYAGSSGSAGVVSLDVAGTAAVLNGGRVSSAAQTDTRGQPGTITIQAGNLVLTDGLISIENDATVATPGSIRPTQIDISTQSLRMNDAVIDAASTGNVAASSIAINYTNSLRMGSMPSVIATASNDGNGGAIAIAGQGPLWMQQSGINTSVRGTTNGNGGNISIDVPFLILDTAEIKANTAAPHASGGDVTIAASALIPSFESFALGGNPLQFNPAIEGLNFVQAAAPNGVNGTLNVTVPTLDIGSSLLALTGAPVAPIELGRSLCSFRRGSSLSIAGRGGLPLTARDPLWADADEPADAPADQSVTPHTHAWTANDDSTLPLFACR